MRLISWRTVKRLQTLHIAMKSPRSTKLMGCKCKVSFHKALAMVDYRFRTWSALQV